MPKPKLNLAETFGGAIADTQQMMAEIQRLRSSGESDDIQTRIEQLEKLLAQQGGKQRVRVDEIRPDPTQPRQTITDAMVQARARSLSQNGQLSPIILIKTDDGNLIFDGELRWRAATLLGWEELDAVTIDLTEDINYMRLLTFLHQQELNPLDKATAIAAEIAKACQIPITEVPSVCNAIGAALGRRGQTDLTELFGLQPEAQLERVYGFGLKTQQEDVLMVLLKLQQGNIGSLATNTMVLLTLPDDLQSAIRSGLPGSHALAMRPLTAQRLGVDEREAIAIREPIIQQAIDEKLTLAQVKALVKRAISQFNPAEPTEHPTVLQIRKLKLDGLNEKDLAALKVALKERLKEIGKRLQSQ